MPKIVKWTEYYQPSDLELDWYSSRSPRDFHELDKHYEGEVMDTVMGCWDVFFIVHCTDGKIRKVNIKQIEEVKNG